MALAETAQAPRQSYCLSKRAASSSFFPPECRTIPNNHIPYTLAPEIILPKVPEQLPKEILTADEVETVINQPGLESPCGVRDRAMMDTLYRTGIRRAETIFNVDQACSTVFIDQGKGRRGRVVPIGERALAWINKYLDEVRESLLIDRKVIMLFITCKGEGFHPNKVTALCGITLSKPILEKAAHVICSGTVWPRRC